MLAFCFVLLASAAKRERPTCDQTVFEIELSLQRTGEPAGEPAGEHVEEHAGTPAGCLRFACLLAFCLLFVCVLLAL